MKKQLLLLIFTFFSAIIIFSQELAVEIEDEIEIEIDLDLESEIEIELDLEDETSSQETSEEDASNIELQVVASKVAKRITDTSADVTVIDQEDLEGSAGSTVTDVLRENGIVALDGSGSRKNGDSVMVRGLSSDKLLVIIDGQRVRDGTMGGISALKRLPLSSIEKIEIIKGPSSFLWGSDAMAGVIHIQTKKGTGTDGVAGNISTTYRNNPYFDNDNHFSQSNMNLSYGWGGGNSAWIGSSLEYGYTWLSPYTIMSIPVEDGDYKVKNERDDYFNFDVYGGTNISFAEIHNIEVNAKYQQENGPIQVDSTQVNEFKKFMTNFNYKVYPLDNLDLNFTTGLSYDAEERISHNQMLNDYYIFNNNEFMFVYYLNDIFTLKGGYTADVEFFEETHNNQKQFNQHTHAFFFGTDVDVDTEVGVDIDVTAGLRYQVTARDITDFETPELLHSASPELGLVIKPAEWIGIKGHVGHSFKVPELITAFRDYFDHTWFYVGPNPDLEPESGWGYSGTLEFYPMKNMTIGAGIFRNDIKNLITYQSTGKTYQGLPLETPENIGKAYTWGINLDTNAAFPTENAGTFSYNLGFEYLWAYEVLEEEDQYINVETAEKMNPRLADRPEYTLSGSFGWHMPEWGTSLKLSGFFFGPGYEYEAVAGFDNYFKETRTPYYTSLDLRIAQEVPPMSVIEEDIENILFFEIKNILNSTYDEDGDGDSDRPGTEFVMGIQLSF